MFGTNTIGSTLSLGKVLNGISRTLSIANLVIPLYQQVKPMIGSARKVMSVLKDLNKPSTSTTTTTINSRTTNNKTRGLGDVLIFPCAGILRTPFIKYYKNIKIAIKNLLLFFLIYDNIFLIKNGKNKEDVMR